VKLVVSPQAADDIEVAARWWQANRPKAPMLFETELVEALELIAQVPLAGAALRRGGLSGIRRVPLGRTRYLLYYRALEEEGVVHVLRLWHASRKRPTF
jgi:plasmid stabilization system protein ParE